MNDRPNQKIMFHVLQVFIVGVNKGLDETLCAAEIKTAVCRAARKISPRDKQSTCDITDRVLKQLVKCGVLFRTVLDGQRDRIGHRVHSEIRHLYTLSKDSWNYLKKNTSVSEKTANLKFDFIRTLLTHFNAIQSSQVLLPIMVDKTIAEIKRENTTAQPAVVHAIPAAETPVSHVFTENTRAVPTKIEVPFISVVGKSRDELPDDQLKALQSIERALSRVKSFSASWHVLPANASPPTCLLACLATAEAYDVASATSCEKIDWCYRRYQLAAELLISEKLVATTKRMRVVKGITIACNYRLWLTPLGKAVARAGKFTDSRPDTEPHFNANLDPHFEEGTTSMLKNSKKQASGTALPTVSTDFIRVMIGNQVVTVHKDDVPKLALHADQAIAEEEVAPAISAQMTLSLDKTLAFVLTDMTTALCKTIADLAVIEIAPGQNADGVHNVHLYHALTKFTDLIISVKHALLECDKNKKPFPASNMPNYGSQVALDMEELAAGRSRQVTMLSIVQSRPDLPHRNITEKANLKRVLWAELESLVNQ